MASDTAPIEEAATSWWARPAGAREVLTVALPLVVSAMSWTVMTFVDRMFLHWVSGDAMSAAFSAGTVWFTLFCFPLGVCTYASTFVSQYFGAGQLRKIGPITWQAVWVAIGFVPFVVAMAPLAPWLFHSAGHDPAVADYEVRYFQILCWGGPAMLIAQALSGFYSGRGQTVVVMIVDAAFALLNVVLDYLWIFGATLPFTGASGMAWGFPAMGIEGAAWATVVSLSLKALTYAALVLLPRYQEQFATLSGFAFTPKLFRRLLRFGGPSGLQMLLDVTGFTVFILLAGQLGAVPYEATSIAFNVSSLAFMPVWGLSLATSILVGQHLGEDRDDLAARATWTTLILALAYMTVLSSLYVFVPDVFLYGFFGGNPLADTPAAADTQAAIDTARAAAVYPLAVNLLRFVAGYNLLDATLMIFAGAIKGAGDMQFVLRVSIVMAIVLATGSWLAVEVWRLGVYGCWTVVTLWVCVGGVIFLLRFLQGKWRTMRVIETKAEGGRGKAE
ncbi:MAG: MATE family efflux transporter [Planctomycetota bacterium]